MRGRWKLQWAFIVTGYQSVTSSQGFRDSRTKSQGFCHRTASQSQGLFLFPLLLRPTLFQEKLATVDIISKIQGRLKQEWRLKLSPPKTKFPCQVITSLFIQNYSVFFCPTLVPFRIKKCQRKERIETQQDPTRPSWAQKFLHIPHYFFVGKICIY